MLFTPEFRPNEKSDKSARKTLCCTGAFGIAGAIFIVLGGVCLVYLPKLIKQVVEKQLTMTEDSPGYPLWKNPPFPILMKLYVFNITNYKDYVENRAKPILQETGPYVYSQKWVKNRIVYNDNDTVSYYNNKTYFFEPQMSNGSEDDIIFTLNMPMMAGAHMFKNAGPVLKVVLTTVFTVTRESLVINVTVKQLVWDGWDDPILKALRQILPNSKYPFTRFSYLFQKNDSNEGLMNVRLGSNNHKDHLSVYSWKYSPTLPMWKKGSHCSRINGTTAEGFPFNLGPDESITFFLPEGCRSITIRPTHEWVDHYNIKGYRYAADYNVLANATENPDNACYCDGNCLPSGAFNVSECYFGGPVAVSFPHFLNADPRYVEQFTGLKPNKSLHSMYIDVEPKTGFPLKAALRVQINAILEKIPGISQFEHVNNTVFPVLWMEQTNILTEDVVQLVRLASTSSYEYSNLFSYGVMSFGSLLVLIGIIYYFYSRHSAKDSEF